MTVYISGSFSSGKAGILYLSAAIIRTRKEFYKDLAEKDTSQDTNNPNIIAARIIKRGGEITHHDINAVLEHQGITITKQELQELKKLQYTEHKLTASTMQDLRNAYPKKTADKVWAIYQLTNNISGIDYIGSTTTLGERLLHYFKKHSKENLRSILADIRATGINLFTLRLLIIPVHLREAWLLIALEQYYILALNPGNNDILVAAGSPGGMWLSERNSATNGIPLYAYLDGQLIYIFNSLIGITNSAVGVLQVSVNTLVPKHRISLNGRFHN